MQVTVAPSITYTGDGLTQIYDFPFDYLRKAFVFVKVNGVNTDAFTITGKTITLDDIPAEGDEITIYRNTSSVPLVSWEDASVLKAADMTLQQTQMLHLIEELQYFITNNIAQILENDISAILNPDFILSNYYTKQQVDDKLKAIVYEDAEEMMY